MDMTVDPQENTQLEPKMQFKARVVKASLAGAVLDIGIGRPALLHVSQIVDPENTPNKKVEDILKPGDEIEVWVKKLTRKDGEERIEMTMIQPLEREWREIKVGDTVKGKVVRLEKFGAFVEIGAERPGLVHISEMAHGYVKVPSDVVKEGDEIEAQIIDVNRRKKQIKLSMKAIQPEPEKVVDERPRSTTTPETGAGGPRRERKPARKPRKSADMDNSALLDSINETAEPEPTSMELAMRAAMEKAKDRKQKQESHKAKSSSTEQEEILARTLENKIQTN
jgi:predicted RNA-binding protein with RPS1 domain